MGDVNVRVLGPQEWETYRALRLSSLEESPEAFSGQLDEERAFDESVWHERMEHASRLVASVDGTDIGLVSVGRYTVLEEGISEVMGFWVVPEHRGTDVATRLMDAAVEEGLRLGLSQLVYWADTDNGRAIAFASGYGFRPTAYRRQTPGADGEPMDEVALVLPLEGAEPVSGLLA